MLRWASLLLTSRWGWPGLHLQLDSASSAALQTMVKLPLRSPRIAPTLRYRITSRYLTTFPVRESSSRFSPPIRKYTQSLSTSRFDRTKQPEVSNTRSMSSDADYAAFLDKANQDTAPVGQKDTSKKGYGTKSVDTAVPQALEQVQEYYTSDADEPFEPVSLKFSGKTLSASRCPALKQQHYT